ncbi:MAG TPA: hypothetical protein VIS48_07490 [Candidatus Kryptonia bacterium]
MRMKHWAVLVLSVTAGMLVGYIDSRPTWDDTGITVAAIIGTGLIIGFIERRRSWLWALSIACGFSVFQLNSNHVSVTLAVLAFSLLGTYLGALVRRAISITSSAGDKGVREK